MLRCQGPFVTVDHATEPRKILRYRYAEDPTRWSLGNVTLRGGTLLRGPCDPSRPWRLGLIDIRSNTMNSPVVKLISDQDHRTSRTATRRAFVNLGREHDRGHRLHGVQKMSKDLDQNHKCPDGQDVTRYSSRFHASQRPGTRRSVSGKLPRHTGHDRSRTVQLKVPTEIELLANKLTKPLPGVCMKHAGCQSVVILLFNTATPPPTSRRENPRALESGLFHCANSSAKGPF